MATSFWQRFFYQQVSIKGGGLAFDGGQRNVKSELLIKDCPLTRYLELLSLGLGSKIN